MPTLSRNIFISLALALVAGGVLLLYTQQVKSQADAQSEAATVLSATRDIDAGTSIAKAVEDGALVERTVREADLAPGHVANADSVAGQLITRDMVTGDQLTAARVGSENTGALSYRVSGIHRALRLPLNENAGLLDDVREGDRVDVFANYVNGTQIITRVPARNVLVLDRATLPSATPGMTASGSITLDVTDEQAMWIVNALRNSTGGKENDAAVWLALAGQDATESDLPETVVAP